MDISLEWQVDRGSVSKLRVTKECSQITMTSIIQSCSLPTTAYCHLVLG